MRWCSIWTSLTMLPNCLAEQFARIGLDCACDRDEFRNAHVASSAFYPLHEIDGFTQLYGQLALGKLCFASCFDDGIDDCLLPDVMSDHGTLFFPRDATNTLARYLIRKP